MPPFTILHVCMGNICRSPMAELLTVLAAGDSPVHTHSVGTGGWHVGGPMDRAAARQVRARGGDPGAFRARQLRGEHIDASDLVLTATSEQHDFVLELRPDAADRTFVLGQFGRLLPKADLSTLPASSSGSSASPADSAASAAASADEVYARGVAIVAAVSAARAGEPPRPDDDLDDPWGRDDSAFTRVADRIEATVRPLTRTLLRGLYPADQGEVEVS